MMEMVETRMISGMGDMGHGGDMRGRGDIRDDGDGGDMSGSGELEVMLVMEETWVTVKT